VDHALHGTGTETFEAIDLLKKVDASKFPAENGASIQRSRLGQSLQQIGILLKAHIGVESLVCGLWGLGQSCQRGRRAGQLSNLLKDLGQARCVHQDMGDRMENIWL